MERTPWFNNPRPPGVAVSPRLPPAAHSMLLDMFIGVLIKSSEPSGRRGVEAQSRSLALLVARTPPLVALVSPGKGGGGRESGSHASGKVPQSLFQEQWSNVCLAVTTCGMHSGAMCRSGRTTSQVVDVVRGHIVGFFTEYQEGIEHPGVPLVLAW